MLTAEHAPQHDGRWKPIAQSSTLQGAIALALVHFDETLDPVRVVNASGRTIGDLQWSARLNEQQRFEEWSRDRKAWASLRDLLPMQEIRQKLHAAREAKRR